MKTASLGAHDDPMRIAKRALCLAVALACWTLANDGLAVTCSVSSSGLAFGNYDVFAAGPTNVSATLTVTCSLDPSDQGATKLQPYVLSLSPGSSKSFTQRTMKNGSNALGYNIYTSNAYSTVWGDGTGSTATQSGTAVLNNGHPTTSSSFTAYGQIPGLQDVAVGSYSDTVIETVTW